MRGGVFGSGPPTTNGTRQFWRRPDGSGNGGQPLRARTGGPTRPDPLPTPDFAGGGAPCVAPDIDPEVFFPVGNGGDLLDAQLAEAIAYCTRCPMATECLTWALDSGQQYGIWGGVRLDGLQAKTKAKLRNDLRRAS